MRSSSTSKPALTIDDPEQYQRFVEAARELGADTPEAGQAFDQALRRALSPREAVKPAPRMAEAPKPKGSRRKDAKPKLGRRLLGVSK